MKKCLLFLLFFMLFFILACKPECPYNVCYCYENKDCQPLWSISQCKWECHSTDRLKNGYHATFEDERREWLSKNFVKNPSESECLTLLGEELPRPDCVCKRIWRGGNDVSLNCWSNFTKSDDCLNDCGKYRLGINFTIDEKEVHLTPRKFICLEDGDNDNHSDDSGCAAFFSMEDSSFYFFKGRDSWSSRETGFIISWEQIFDCSGSICSKFEYDYSYKCNSLGGNIEMLCKDNKIIEFKGYHITDKELGEECTVNDLPSVCPFVIPRDLMAK